MAVIFFLQNDLTNERYFMTIYFLIEVANNKIFKNRT